MSWKDVEGHYSHSQLSMYRRCPKQYEYRYVKGIRRPPSFKMTLGTTTHVGMEHNLQSKYETKRSAPLADVLDAFSSAWDKARKETIFGTYKPGTIKDVGVEILKIHHRLAAPTMTPKSPPEQKFVVNITGVSKPIVGYIDFHGDIGRWKNTVQDHKTTSRRKTQDMVDLDEQLTLYSYAKKQLTGKAADHVGNDVYTANAAGEDFSRVISSRGPERFKFYEESAKQIDKGIRSGVFPATNNPSACSWCGYKDLCPLQKV